MATKTVKVKAWAVISPTEMYWHEHRPLVYSYKADAKFNAYADSKVVPCTITYQLPSKRK